MGQGFHDERRRRSQLLKLLFGVLILGALTLLLGLAYMVGLREQAMQTEELARETAGLRVNLERERQARAEVTAARDASLADAAALRQRIQAEVPTGLFKQLLDIARERVAAGVRPERVASALQRAENAKNCEPPAARRFTVKVPPLPTAPVAPGARVPAAPPPAQPSAIGENLLLLVEGQSARDPAGQIVAGFDLAEPVQLRFTSGGAKVSDIEGKLPFSYVLFSGNWEYRIAFTAAARGQVTAVVERCPFP